MPGNPVSGRRVGGRLPAKYTVHILGIREQRHAGNLRRERRPRTAASLMESQLAFHSLSAAQFAANQICFQRHSGKIANECEKSAIRFVFLNIPGICTYVVYVQQHTSCAPAATWARSLFFNNIPDLLGHILKLLRLFFSGGRRINSLSRWADCGAPRGQLGTASISLIALFCSLAQTLVAVKRNRPHRGSLAGPCRRDGGATRNP
jgi:hypothetical protein